MNYRELLENSFIREALSTTSTQVSNRLDFLAEHVFDFLIDDRVMSRFLAKKAVEVCAAINNECTEEYTSVQENYNWFVLLLNMTFFHNKIDVGMQIRHMDWLDDNIGPIELESIGLWDGEDNLDYNLEFDLDEWETFVEAMVDFAQPDMDSVEDSSASIDSSNN